MKVYNVRQIEKILKQDGWRLIRITGHKQYKHPDKKRTVSIPNHGDNFEINSNVLSNIFKQAGWK